MSLLDLLLFGVPGAVITAWIGVVLIRVVWEGWPGWRKTGEELAKLASGLRFLFAGLIWPALMLLAGVLLTLGGVALVVLMVTEMVD